MTIRNEPGSRDGAGRRIDSTRCAFSRAIGFFASWLILTGGDPADLPAGLIAVAATTWASLSLMPPGPANIHPLRLVGYVLHFLRQAVVAGLDVALRALDPRLPLRPGFVIYQTHLPPGARRNAFCSVMSLMPGTLPSGPAAGGGLMIHCIDVTAPVTDQLAAEEALFVRLSGGQHGDD